MKIRDAKYVIKEINNISYYTDQLIELDEIVSDLQTKIDNATVPHSPQGMENTGAERAFSFNGKDSYLNEKITQKDKAIEARRLYAILYDRARKWYRNILDETDDKDFVIDYFNGRLSKQEIEMKYCISKAYKKIVDIVMDCKDIVVTCKR